MSGDEEPAAPVWAPGLAASEALAEKGRVLASVACMDQTDPGPGDAEARKIPDSGWFLRWNGEMYLARPGAMQKIGPRIPSDRGVPEKDIPTRYAPACYF